MLNDKQRKIFSEVIDLNWDMKNENKNFTRKMELYKKLEAKKEELKESMGEAKYNKFMDAGTKMFS